MKLPKQAIAKVVSAAVLFSSLSFSQQFLSLDTHVERKIDSIVKIMTLEEKVGQLNQRVGVDTAHYALVRQGRIGAYLGVVGAAATLRLQQVAVEESRLHIPLLFGLDVVHGYKTVFPIPLGEASTWNPELLERAERIAAKEATAGGIHWTFAPMVDIARDPRWGRIAEGSGEDPFLGSIIAEAKVRGFQGKSLNDPQSLLACAKHFAAYGAAEAGRDYNTVDLSERTLREVYLPPFHAAVKAGVGTLMASFNEIGGVPSSANKWLLTDVLREEWGFKGFVVSDWESILEMMKHGIGATRTDVGVSALNAGLDMDMVSQIYQNEMPDAVRSTKMSEETLNQSVKRVLRAKFALGLFENPYRNCDTVLEKGAMLLPEHVSFARQVAQESIVLLKNKNELLPLKKSLKRIAVIGPLANAKKDPLGPWAGIGDPKNVVTVLQGLKAQLSPGTKLLYTRGCEVIGDSGLDIAKAVRTAKQAEVVVLVLGEKEDMSGEAASRSDIGLPGRQEDLLKAIHKTGTPIVLVLMNGRPLTIPWAAENIPAILETWFLGVQTGNAIADVLLGDINPSGKLPVSFPRNVGQIPIYYNHKNTGRPINDTDKYTSKYIDVPNTPLFPFGFGLSYTTYAYTNLQLSSSSISLSQEIEISVDVANTGKRDGAETVQLYVQDLVGSVTRPVKELKGFQKIHLKAGEKKTVRFTLRPENLAFYNLEMKKVVEPGVFKVMVGGNSVDVIETRFEVHEK
jgi:beta-glucosidase